MVIVFCRASGLPSSRRVLMGEDQLLKRGPEAWVQHRVSPLQPLAAGGTTCLLAHAVADNTARQWIPQLRAFLTWAVSTQKHMALAEYFDHMCCAERCQPWLGTSVTFGLLHVMPEYSGSLYLASRFFSWVASPLDQR